MKNNRSVDPVCQGIFPACQGFQCSLFPMQVYCQKRKWNQEQCDLPVCHCSMHLRLIHFILFH
jgi:hypothetical protein